MALSIDTSPEHLARLIRDGISANLEGHIRRELLASIDHIVSKIARDLADSTKIHVETFHSQNSSQPGMPPEVRVQLSFNNDKVTYETPRAVGGRQESFGAVAANRVGS